MSEYSPLVKTIIQETQAREHRLPLMDETSGTRFLLQPHPTEKVCLFFHGFTAIPEQFMTIGEAFFKEGYNVLIPLLPGHGIAGNWDGDNPPPLPENQQVYRDFGLQWLKIAQLFGKNVIVGGLSGGSTLAAWLALEHPEKIYRALLFAPYLSNTNKLVDVFVKIFNIYFEWKTKPGLVSFGYRGFVMPALRVFLDMGDEVLQLAQTHPAAPMFIISSESDRAVGNEEHESLFKDVLRFQFKSWYHCFDRFLEIPHNMMTKAEGNNYVDLVVTMAKAYVESDLTWFEVQELGERIRQGYSFNSVVSELNLSHRASPDLQAILLHSSIAL